MSASTKETKVTRSAPRYELVIETSSYAGNFERAMTAFCTGQVGDCEVGKEFAEMFDEFGFRKWGDDYNDDENHFVEFMEQRTCQDDNSPCFRPCTGGYNEDGHYNNVVIYFEHEPADDEIINVIKERAHDFSLARQKFYEAKSYGWDREVIKVLGIKWVKIITERTSEEI